MKSVEPLELTNDFGELQRLDPWMAIVQASFELPQNIANELRLCLHELVANAIMHGCRPGSLHRISVGAGLDGDDLMLVLTDDGAAFDPVSVPEPKPLTDMETAPIGGLGLKLVRACADSLGYVRRDGLNCLTVTRHLAPRCQ